MIHIHHCLIHYFALNIILKDVKIDNLEGIPASLRYLYCVYECQVRTEDAQVLQLYNPHEFRKSTWRQMPMSKNFKAKILMKS